MAKFLVDGGIYVLAQIPLAVVGLALCVAYLLQALRRRDTRLGGLAWASVAGILALGLFGLAVGLDQLMVAVPAAAPTQRGALELMGGAIASYSVILACGIAALETTVAAVAATIRANRPATEARS